MEQTNNKSPWMDVEQAAEYTGFAASTIKQRARTGQIKHTRVNDAPNGELRFRIEWLNEWLESRAQGGEN